jgi:uncharacterized membrane protein YphA (DoxX/SURF4 family)
MSVVQDSTNFMASENLAESPKPARPDWNLAQRIAFRFTFSYLVIYNLPFPLYYIPYISNVGRWYSKFIYALVPWVGKHLFHLNITVMPNGSGDTTFNYVEIFCFAIFAIIATFIWTLLDRKRKQYHWLYDWLRVYVRYKLAVAMLSYGISKIFKLQMSFPGLSTLLEQYGNSSPAGLLWNFMGYSTVYETFAGAAETVGGLLLFFRRTTTLGAIVVSGVMLNVMMMNYCFDVPVKISSTHLFLMALFLLLPDLRSLTDLLVWKRTTTPAELGKPFRTKWMKIGGWAVKAIFIGYYILFLNVKYYYGARNQYGDYAPKSALYGIYKVDEFTRNGQTLPPLTTDANRWDKVIFQVPQYMQVKAMTDSRSSVGGNKIYDADVNTEKNTLTLFTDEDKDKKYVLTYMRPDADHLILQGTLASDSLIVKAQRIDTKLLLVTRGYHWINEYPLIH